MSSQSVPATPIAKRESAWLLLAKGTALLVVVVATALAIVLLIPDGNDYAEATLLKHHRLENTEGKRIVLVGGSNLAFGMDSTILERMTGCSVINMGMNGYLGINYMLAETRPYLHPSDIVLISLEYDNFFKSPQGTAVDQLMIVKANPSALRYLDSHQRVALLSAIPYVAQQKVLRVLREAADSLWMVVFNLPAGSESVSIDNIESLSGFTERGDLTSHLGVVWPWEREDGVDATNTQPNGEVLPLLEAFTAEMRGRGIHVLVSPTPVIRAYYGKHQRSLDTLFEQMSRTTVQVPSPPSAYVFDDGLFFDTVYHLNAEGRRLRSERVASDIVRHLSDDGTCGKSNLITKN